MRRIVLVRIIPVLRAASAPQHCPSTCAGSPGFALACGPVVPRHFPLLPGNPQEARRLIPACGPGPDPHRQTFPLTDPN